MPTLSVGSMAIFRQANPSGSALAGTKAKLSLSSAGLTLLELIVVLIIVGLSTMLVLPRFTSSLAGLDLKTSVQKTSSALRYARSQAVTEQVTYYAVFDFEKNGCFIRAEKPDNGENFYTETKAAAAETVDNPQEQASTVKSYFLPENVKIEKALITDKEIESGFFVIEFYPAGNSSGGAVIFIDAKKRRFKINVDFITGMVDIADPDLSKS